MLQTIVTLGWRRLAQAALGLGMTAALVACGGGGGGAGDSVFPGTGGSTGTPGNPSSTDTATVSLTLSSATVTAGAPATAAVTVVNKSGAPIPGLVVKFSTDAGMGSFSAASALTDANGAASVVVSPAQASSTGADTLRATVSYAGKDYAASTGFQLTATNVTIASFTSDVAQGGSLSAYGQANLTVNLSGTSATTPVNLVLTSSCAAQGKGTITPASQTTSTGKATFTFRDGGCGAVAGSENLQIAVTGTSLTQSLTLPVASPLASSIGFVSSQPSSIYLKGSGYVESANVTFQVKDANNNGLPGQTVVLEPSVLVGGLTLDGQTGSVSKTTDSNGNVIVRINAGTVPTPVRIKATLQGSNISTVSSALAIAVGLPSQLSFSFSQGTKNIEGASIDGTPNTYTIIAADRLGNPVPDGTAINFVATGGQVQAIKQTALDGRGIATATANFATASPVPANGRITVVAYALGEESFLDTNGNNVYDAGEDFQDLGDIYVDRLYDGTYQASDDQYISLGTGEAKACLSAASPLLGTDVTIPVRPSTCGQAWGRAYVRRALQTIFSTSAANPMWGKTWPAGAVGVGGVCTAPTSLTTTYVANVAQNSNFRQVNGTLLFAMDSSGVMTFNASDANSVAFNPVAAGTVVSATSATDGLTASVLGGSPVPSTLSPTGVQITYKFDLTKADQGTIAINFRSPSGLVTSQSIFVSTRTYGSAVVKSSPATVDENYRASLAQCLNN